MGEGWQPVFCSPGARTYEMPFPGGLLPHMLACMAMNDSMCCGGSLALSCPPNPQRPCPQGTPAWRPYLHKAVTKNPSAVGTSGGEGERCLFTQPVGKQSGARCEIGTQPSALHPPFPRANMSCSDWAASLPGEVPHQLLGLKWSPSGCQGGRGRTGYMSQSRALAGGSKEWGPPEDQSKRHSNTALERGGQPGASRHI